jgi:type I protein arginine methyltransferase
MLPTVLWARDRYLVENGLLFPSKASIYIAALEDAKYKKEKIHFWDDVYGFDMSCIKPIALREPLVDVVEAESIISDDSSIIDIDISSVSSKDLEFSKSLSLFITKNETVHALVAWFTVAFPGDGERKLILSTGPYHKQTHWKQTIFYLPADLVVRLGEELKVKIECKQNVANLRNLDIRLLCSSLDGEVEQEYMMG